MTTSHPFPIATWLDGRVALVTGAGTGIGRAAALAFAAAGAAVALAGRRVEPLQALAHDIAAAGGRADVFSVDLADADGAAGLPAQVVGRMGRLDAAFNNAGITAFAPMDALTVDDFDRVMATNVRAVWLLVKQEVAVMRAAGRGGAIVNTSSIAATGGTVGLTIYSASKGALDAMIRPAALEAGADGIRINNVSPGVVRTPMTEVLPDEAFAAFGSHAALGRVGEPADVGDVAVWLCSDAARFVTGQSIVVDGGFNIAGMR